MNKHFAKKFVTSVAEFRAASMEFLFSSVSTLVINEATRQLQQIFGHLGTTTAPPGMIVVHIRWGDKLSEPNYIHLSATEYTNAVQKIVTENNITDVHILLCTEDPVAYEAFMAASKPDWLVYTEPNFQEYIHFRNLVIENVTGTLPAKGEMPQIPQLYNLPTLVSRKSEGKSSLWALASLLVALESNYFVLTTKSNWSRLMNELRKNVIDPRCNGCTRMIDLEYDEC